MRTNFNHLEAFRIRSGQIKSHTGDRYGAFQLWYEEGPSGLICICSDGLGDDPEIAEMPRWEHVSLRAHSPLTGEARIPTWDEMCYAKSMFWEDEENVVQFHPPKSQYVNHHPYVLHLWRPLFTEIPTPPKKMIA